MHDTRNVLDREAAALWAAGSRAGPQRPAETTRPTRHRLVREGVATGAVGASTALLWLIVAGAWRGRGLETPLDLGAYLAHAAGGSGAQTSGQLAALFVAFVYAGFVLVGLLGVALVHHARRARSTRGGAFAAAITAMWLGAEALVLGLLVTVGTAAVGTTAWANVVSGSLLGVLAAGWYVWRTHSRDDRRRAGRE